MNSSMTITDDNFEQEVLKATIPVIVDFWAPWCGPCSMVGPILENIADKYSEQIKVVKINVDTNTEIAQLYNVMSIPAIFFFRGGKLVDQIIGAMPEATFIDMVEKVLE